MNLLVIAPGRQVPADRVDIYSLSTLPLPRGSIQYGGAYEFTAYMMAQRLNGEIEGSSSANLPIAAMEWVQKRGLGNIPDLDPIDNRAYLTRVWSAHSSLNAAKSE